MSARHVLLKPLPKVNCWTNSYQMHIRYYQRKFDADMRIESDYQTNFYLLYFYLLYKYYIFNVISKMNNRDISDQSYFESINSNKSVVT